MSRLAREHPEDDRYQSLTGQYEMLSSLWDMRDGPKPACPHCHYRSCLLGIDQCEQAKEKKDA